MMKLSQTRRTDRYKRQSGFTLIELLIALAVLAIIVGGTVTYLNLSKSKGQTLYSTMHGVSNAATRFDLDTSCYPFQTNLLFDKSAVSGNTNNSCGVSVSNRWNGPYMQDKPTNSNGNIEFPQIGKTVAIKVASGSFLPNGSPTQYAVEAINVPNNIAHQEFKACAGGAATQTSGSWTIAGNCLLGSASSGRATVGLVFAGNG